MKNEAEYNQHENKNKTNKKKEIYSFNELGSNT